MYGSMIENCIAEDNKNILNVKSQIYLCKSKSTRSIWHSKYLSIYRCWTALYIYHNYYIVVCFIYTSGSQSGVIPPPPG